MVRLYSIKVRNLLVLLAVILGAASVAIYARGQELQYPIDVAVAPSGDIFLADRNLPGVWKVAGGKLSVHFQGSKKFRTPLNAVRCLAIDANGKLLAGDTSTRDVFRFDDEGKPVSLADGRVGMPMGIAVEPKGEFLLVSDLERECIWRVPSIGGEPTKLADVSAPTALALDADGRLWVLSRGENALYRVSPDGKVETLITGREFLFPNAIVLDAEGTAYVTDGYAKAIYKVKVGDSPDAAEPTIEKWVEGDPLVNPVGMAWQGDSLLVIDPRAKSLFRISTEGKIGAVELEAAGQ
jgi:sugar lactone lactonase YvrE